MAMAKPKGGRPAKQIDQAEFEKLCALQCTENEICSWFECCPDTLGKWCRKNYRMGFSDIFSIKREKGRISLRRAQYQLAEKSAAMAIFLGKQYLGQKDGDAGRAIVNVGKNDGEDGNIVIYLPDDGRNGQPGPPAGVTPNAEDSAPAGATA